MRQMWGTESQLLASLLDLGPGVFQGDGAVEDQTVLGRVRVDAEVSKAFELETVGGLGIHQRVFNLGVCDNFERVRIEIRGEVLPFLGLVRVGRVEKLFVETNLGIESISRGNPMNGCLHLAFVGSVAAAGFRVVGAMDLNNFPGRVLSGIAALDEVAAT